MLSMATDWTELFQAYDTKLMARDAKRAAKKTPPTKEQLMLVVEDEFDKLATFTTRAMGRARTAADLLVILKEAQRRNRSLLTHIQVKMTK
jgi:hypothetical protein